MSNMALQSLFRQCPRLFTPEIPHVNSRKIMPFSVVINPTPIKFGGSSSSFKPKRSFSLVAGSAANSAHTQTPQLHETIYKKTFQLKRIEKKEGVLHISLNKEGDYWRLTVGCSLQGKWVLHWGVNYIGVDGSEWDLPPKEMRPPDSIVIKDYAIESPFTKSSALEREVTMQEVSIYFLPRNNIAAINFVLKDEEFGSWYHSKGRNFMVPLAGHLLDGGSVARTKRGTHVWSGIVEQLMAREKNRSKDSIEASTKSIPENSLLQEFLEEQPIIRDIPIVNSLNVSVTKCPKTAKTLVYLETDLLGKVVVHWGVCQGRNETWQAPAVLHPPNTELYRNKALRTKLQTKADGSGSKAMFTIDEKILGFAFVLKFGEDAWLNNKGHDFYIPLSPEKETEFTKLPSGSIDTDEKSSKQKEYTDDPTYTDEIVQDLQELLTEFSSEKKWNAESEEAAYILEGIEKLAAEAYNVFRGSTTTSSKEAVKGGKVEQVPPKISSGTGTGFEILCQGFNWESHNSGRWYMDLQEKAAELSLMGFTVVWLPPPTDSVAPEGYMPKDLYNLNSRYGTIDELKTTVNKFHEIGIKVLGDVVLNHRCAEYQNQNGIYNIFGGPLNWDDRAVVSDDPHFQGKGNKSSGDNFHAAPNIDHSQDFVRRDIKEWLCWLRKDIGYDGWRLDYVRGFWGGYVKDYIDSSEPYFAVGEFWDSLSYTYGEMDYNQDAHRQKIIDWINDAGGSAGAFDVTTKGILHSALERCEYWRLSDTKGKPPGVVGWWPSRAVTFIENHDTGSTQGHWRFPSGKEMQGYAYILTHPGTPTVFYDHIFSHYQAEITALMSFRTKKELHCRSSVKISKAEKDVYAAIIDDKVAMKIGPGHYEPSKESHQWRLVIEGRDYKIWEAL